MITAQIFEYLRLARRFLQRRGHESDEEVTTFNGDSDDGPMTTYANREILGLGRSNELPALFGKLHQVFNNLRKKCLQIHSI